MLSLSNNFYAQLLEEERKLRNIAEGKVRELYALLEELAVLLAAEEVEKIRREKRGYFNELSVDGWRKFFMGVISRDGRGWRDDGEVHLLREEIEKLRRENEKLKAELLSREKRPAPAVQVQQAQEAQVNLDIKLPPRPPSKFSDLFHTWAREGYILAVLAVTGYSVRRAIAEIAGKHFGISAGAGSLKRLFISLDKKGLTETRTFKLPWGAQVALSNLTELGKEIIQACGIEVVEAEWERLMRLHFGQEEHAALTCVFTFNARRFGYCTEVCPEAVGNFEPDVLISKDGEKIYVEVEGESGEDTRRMKKWRNQEAVQGFVALCAPTPEVRKRLVAEAKAAAKHGKATDIKTLIADSKDLWCEEW